MLKKIVAIGPESTGKSTLCEQLAAHYKTTWCPEYAREYLLTHGKKYEYDDLLTIAEGQLKLEDEHIEKVRKSGNPGVRKKEGYSHGLSAAPAASLRRPQDFPTPGLLFIDTDMYVMKVWCEFVFGKCHRFILDNIVQRDYDLYLLCNTDLPWTKDELREYPDLETRQKLFHIYKDIMINQAVPWAEIGGNDEERLQNAIIAVNNLLKS
jgi:nicotinamide riboside kinase